MQPTRVLIADDSPTARLLMRAILSEEPDLQTVGEAANGAEAVELTEKLRPDVVVMDVHMPVLDGIEATRQIMQHAPTPIVMVSAVTQRDVDLSLTATQAGALIALPKPDSPTSPRYREQRAELVAMVRAMAQVKVVRRWAADRRASPRPHRRAAAGNVELIAIAASTGGPAALRTVIGHLPANLEVPIVVVQHIARDFTAGFARWLGEGLPLDTVLAASNTELRAGRVYVAPEDVHTGVNDGPRLVFSHAAPIEGFRPSATFLFESLARSFGGAAVGVVLTGMGSDGANGLVALRQAGGYVIGQDEATSIVYGMAQEAWLRGAVDELLPLDRIAERLVELVRAERDDG
ncbi:MAG: chemotaxis-specific protein-glutamate methyltransferase CheB [Longimicrobiales bacterium]